MHFKNAPIQLLILLALVFGANNTAGVMIDRIVAIVNDDVITQSELDSFRQLGLHVSGLSTDKEILDQRIDHHLMLQQIAKQPPLSITEERFQEVVDSFIKKYGNMEEFLSYLNSIGMNYQDFEKELREQLRISAFIALRFRPFVNVSIEEAQTYYDEVYKRRFELAGMQAPSFALSFDQIQQEIVDSQVKDRTEKWLTELRQSSNITIKS